MSSFLFDVLKDLKDKDVNFSDLKFIIPSKRAGLFLKHELSSLSNQTMFAPEIISIEEFIEQLSLLKSVSNSELLFEFYNSYYQLTKKDQIEPFESFSKWAQMLIQDFNEIDRYLIPHEHIFNYLSAIQDLNHWSLQENKTEFVKNYLDFWNKLHQYYTHFTNALLEKGIAYQGLIYRKAVAHLDAYIAKNSGKQHVFLGFNALNTAEETIVQQLTKNKLARIYWDIDKVFMDNPKHDAALFTRRYKSKWDIYKKNPFNWISDNYSKEKNINVFGVPKNIGQAKYIGSILKQLHDSKASLDSTAVVLGDENLLIPVLNSIPDCVNALNITMGLPLKAIPLASLFESLFQVHKQNSQRFYYRDVIKLLTNQFIHPLFVIEDIDYATLLIDHIQHNNIIYVTNEKLKQINNTCQHIIDLMFSDWQDSVATVLQNCSQLITIIKNHLNIERNSNTLNLEYLFRFNELFNELTQLNSRFDHINSISTLHDVYKDLISSEQLDFQGEPLQGLQIMGMLESRVLDFETLIISSVNEGILPSGKTNNSFIPFDVKLENKLPTYKEKDAVYTYHFYRLLQRAKNIYILYNTESDGLTGGEKSRFITQLEIEAIHKIKHQVIAPQIPNIRKTVNTIYKNEDLLKELKTLANKGFSPSSLTSYIRNPLDFYFQKILNIKDPDEVEETIAANTLGTVVHNTLEDFYAPLVGQFLTVDHIKAFKNQIDSKVNYHFRDVFKEGDFSKGKNLIVFEIAKRYVSNFLNKELEEVKAGNQIKILAIEANNKVSLDIPELGFPIVLKGKVDRVDEYNGITRIIDYKTGKVEQGKVELVDWEDITTDYDKYSKSFQILTYAYMMFQSKQIQLPVEAGIISFKNLNAGFLKFAKKDKAGRGAQKETLISNETLECFITELKALIIEICNPDIPFTEKEI